MKEKRREKTKEEVKPESVETEVEPVIEEVIDQAIDEAHAPEVVVEGIGNISEEVAEEFTFKDDSDVASETQDEYLEKVQEQYYPDGLDYVPFFVPLLTLQCIYPPGVCHVRKIFDFFVMIFAQNMNKTGWLS